MALKLGGIDIPDGAGLKIGAVQASKIYLGANEVWADALPAPAWSGSSVVISGGLDNGILKISDTEVAWVAFADGGVQGQGATLNSDANGLIDGTSIVLGNFGIAGGLEFLSNAINYQNSTWFTGCVWDPVTRKFTGDSATGVFGVFSTPAGGIIYKHNNVDGPEIFFQ